MADETLARVFSELTPEGRAAVISYAIELAQIAKALRQTQQRALDHLNRVETQ